MVGRSARWSQGFTDRLSAAIPARGRHRALTTIKAVHTLIFASVGAAVIRVLLDGLRGRPDRGTAVALGIALGESALFVSNNGVCPLTPLAEELGSANGSVADIFLPRWFARQIPLVAGIALFVGVALSVRALLYGTTSKASVRRARPGLRNGAIRPSPRGPDGTRRTAVRSPK